MDHDHPYKELFSQPELVADLLRLADIADGLDLTSLDRRNGSYVSENWKNREDDVIWRVRTATGDWYVYLLIEFQSTVDRDMAVRVMTYIGLLWQDLRHTGAIAPDAPLPPVLPLVLYNGSAPWLAPRAIDAAMAPVSELLRPFQPQATFLLLDEVRMALRDTHERNLAAAVFRLERTGSPLEHLAIAQAVAAWVRGPGRAAILTAFQRWYARTLSLKHSLPDTLNPFSEAPMMTERIEAWTAMVEARGEAKGKAGLIIEMVLDGTISASVGHLRLQHLHEQGEISVNLLAASLERLPPSNR